MPGAFVDALAKIEKESFWGQGLIPAFAEQFPGNQFGDRFQYDLAGEFAGISSAHTVAHGKDVIVIGEGKVALLAEEVDFLMIEA